MNNFFDKKIKHPDYLYKFTPNSQDIEIYKEHVNYLERSKKITAIESKARTLLFICMFPCLLFYPFVFFFSLLSIVMINVTGLYGFLVRKIIHKNYIFKNKSLKDIYFTLKSARNRNNITICIFCGDHSFSYDSENCIVSCTQCKNYLYPIEKNNLQLIKPSISEYDIEHILDFPKFNFKEINPTTGLPMLGDSGMDVGGYLFGETIDSNHHNDNSFSNDHFHNDF